MDPERNHPLRRIPRKLRNYSLAASHGVPIPTVYDVWADLADVDLSALPATFVIKSDRGAGARGVLPLRRRAHDTFQVVGGDDVLTQEEVRVRLQDRSVGPPFFAEEILVQPGTRDLPEDVKIYMFYGQVGHIMLRRMPRHGSMKHARFRFLTEDGVDLGDDIAPDRMIDASIQPPDPLDTYLDIARHLSRAVALPFVRVDVYDTTRGPVFGELTRGPGGRQGFRADHDLVLGEMWDRAQLRLDLDLVAGRPMRNLIGENPYPDLYPVRGSFWEDSPDSPHLQPVSCDTWCLRASPSPQVTDGPAAPSTTGQAGSTVRESALNSVADERSQGSR